jgi:FtsZ-binding cell division protein ZapB
MQILENKVVEAAEAIKKLKEENKFIKTENMKLFSELELMKNDIRVAGKIRTDYEHIMTRDKKIKEKIFALKGKIDRLNI